MESVSRKDTLLLIRVPYGHAKRIGENPRIFSHFGRIVYVTVDDPPDREMPFLSAHIEGVVDEADPEKSASFLKGVISSSGVTHAVISQPLLWYSEMAAQVCREMGVKVVWFEKFPGGKAIFDTIGCQYTKESELSEFWDKSRPVFPEIPAATPAAQPEYLKPDEVLRKYGVRNPTDALVLFGQSHIDMALVDSSGLMKYEDWIRAIIERNPKTTILYKPHPVYKLFGSLADPVLPMTEAAHVKIFDESIFTAFEAFPCFAAYSSTVIMEGAFQGRFFATGGRHFLDEEGLSLRLFDGDKAAGVIERLLSFQPKWETLIHRLGFITRRYALYFSSSRLLDKILLPPEEYYSDETCFPF